MRTFAFVAKPTAGGALIPAARVLREAGADVTVDYTRGLDHAGRLAREAVGDGRIVVAVGGDGLVGAVAGAVAVEGGVLGVVPAGRGNDFARQIGLLAAPARASEVLLEGRERRVDLIEAAGRLVTGNVHAGVDSIAAAFANWTVLPGALAYQVGGLRAITTWRPVSYRVCVDGDDHEQLAYTVVAANSGYYGAGLHVVPSARPDDGLMDVLIIRHAPKRLFFSVMRELRTGDHVHRPEVVVLRGRTVTIEADRELPVYGDGESLGRLPVTARLRPGALNILCA